MKLKKGSDLKNKAYCRFNQSGPGVHRQKGALTSGTACIGLSWTILSSIFLGYLEATLQHPVQELSADE